MYTYVSRTKVWAQKLQQWRERPICLSDLLSEWSMTVGGLGGIWRLVRSKNGNVRNCQFNAAINLQKLNRDVFNMLNL
jgi:hypothetical protein